MSDLFDEASTRGDDERIRGQRVLTVHDARRIAHQVAQREAAWARREPPPDAPDLHLRRVTRDAWEAIRCPADALLRQVGDALTAVHTASNGDDVPLVELMEADLFGIVTEAVAAYSSRDVALTSVGGADG